LTTTAKNKKTPSLKKSALPDLLKETMSDQKKQMKPDRYLRQLTKAFGLIATQCPLCFTTTETGHLAPSEDAPPSITTLYNEYREYFDEPLASQFRDSSRVRTSKDS